MKRLWKTACVGLVVAWGLVCGGNTALAEVDGNWEYSYSDSDFTAGVYKYTGSLSSPTVPSRFSRRVNTGEKDEDGDYIYKTYTYKVTSLDGTFINNTNITSVSLPSSVTSIGAHTFSGCTGLTSVAIPDSVTYIGIEAFYNCPSLASVTIPDSVTHIGGGAFEDCSGLASVTIGNGVTIIVNEAFSNCHGLRSVTIGNSVTRIEYAAFSNCWSLTHVTIPDSVTWIQREAFSNCRGLTSMTIGNSVTNIGFEAFYNCRSLASVTIPDSVTSIGGFAFYDCANLKSLTIGGSVKNIGHDAFSGCSGLTRVTIPDSVTNIDSRAFYYCTNLTSVTIGSSVKDIGAYAFRGCSGLTSVTIPASVRNIWFGAFCDCSRLTSVTFEGAPPSVDRTSRTPEVFDDVAVGARGYYTAGHAFQWKAVLGGGQYWQGLIMAEIPGPVLRVDSANPAAGSITLAWSDEGGGEGVTYSVWRGTGKERSTADCVASNMTGNTWKDEGYWEAKPVLEPLNYWVVADGGGYGERVSEPVERRRRFGVFVGLSDYSWNNWERPFPQPAKDAQKLRDLFVSDGGMDFGNTELLQNSKAKWEGVSNAIAVKVESVLPGDLFVLYIASHGEYTNGFARVVLYDKRLNMTQLFGMLSNFNSEAVVIPIIMACHSGEFADYADGSATNEASPGFKQFVNAGLAMCRGNMPVLVSCGFAESSAGFTSFQDYSDFGEAFFHYGWEKGYADGEVARMGVPRGNGDGTVSFMELMRYAKGFARGASDTKPAHVQWSEEHETLLARMQAGRVPQASVLRTAPDAPATITASDGTKDSRIDVSWESVAGADWYCVYRLKEGGSTNSDDDWECLTFKTSEPKYQDEEAALGGYYHYRVRALNGAGASEPSSVATGCRGTPRLLEWLLEQGLRLGLGGTAWAMASMPSANGETLEACYVSGIDPLDANATFTAELCREDGKWKAKPKGGEKEGRVYSVEGKKEMSDEFWTDVTTVEDLEAEGWHFFRLGVELAE